MNRKFLYSLIAVVLASLTLISCASAPQSTAEETKTTEEVKTESERETEKKEEPKKTEEAPKGDSSESSIEDKPQSKTTTTATKVEDLTTPQKLAALPIANASMSTDELRQLCVDFFRLSASFPWIPGDNYEDSRLNINRETGKVYGGIPYITTGSGNIYRAMEYYDPETGIIDMTPFKAQTTTILFGNACSGGCGWAWGRVINSSTASWTYTCTEQNGCLRVGPYTYKDVKNFTEVRSTSTNRYNAKIVCQENGEQTMYESYAQLKLADGLVEPGHVRMVTVPPVVVRNADGTINGKESYLSCTEQIKYVNEEDNLRTQSDGTTFMAQGFVDKKYTFENLFKTYYIPFTYAEFLGTDPVEPAEASLGITADGASLKELAAATLTANYAISDAFLTIKAPDGTELASRVSRAGSFYVRSLNMKKTLLPDPAVNMFKTHAGNGNTIEISVQLSNGEKVVAYSGNLLP